MADFTNIRLAVLGANGVKYLMDVLHRPNLYYSRPSLAGTWFCIWYFTLIYSLSWLSTEMLYLDKFIISMYDSLNITKNERERIQTIFDIAVMFFNLCIGVIWFTYTVVLKVHPTVLHVPFRDMDRLYGYFIVPIVIASAVQLIS